MIKTPHIIPKVSDRRWHLIDAKNKVLGRLATEVTYTLSGKGKRTFSPHIDGGDFVVVINAGDVKITGNNKPEQKIDFRHSGYPGGDTMTPYGTFMKEKPERAVMLAVKGMLPKNRLRGPQLARLKVYRGATHPHGANLAQKEKAVASTSSNK
jgi:large subunit ribosomal protein L13